MTEAASEWLLKRFDEERRFGSCGRTFPRQIIEEVSLDEAGDPWSFVAGSDWEMCDECWLAEGEEVPVVQCLHHHADKVKKLKRVGR